MNRSTVLSIQSLRLITGIIVLATENNSEHPRKLLNLKYQNNKNYTKHWMNYIYKSIDILASNGSYFSLFGVVDILKTIQHEIHIRNYVKYYDMKLKYGPTYNKHNATYILYRFRGYGKITYWYSGTELTPLDNVDFLHHVWNFQPSKELRIKIVFHRLKIHEYEYGLCMQNVTINSIYLSNNLAFVFCGDYSNFYLYPPWIQVYFNLFYDSVPYFKLDVIFDLMSADVIENILLQTEVDLNYITIYNMKHLQLMLYIFVIKVPKYQHILMKLNLSIRVMVFDGPGYLSESITATKNSVILLSSFQCLLKMESHRFIHFKEIIYKGIIKYSKEILLIKQVHTFQYNDSFNGHRKHFVLLLKSYTSTKISIFRSQFHFRTFKDDINCKYGGISIFDIKHGQLQETKSDCITRVDDQLYLQPYYSKSNETIIVIYSYPCYSKISVLLNISWNYCHVVEINTCATRRTCAVSSKLCSTMFEGQQVNIRAEKRKVYSLLTVLPLEEKCIVLLFYE